MARRALKYFSCHTNPAVYLFDFDLADRTDMLLVKYALPYSDLTSLTAAEKQRHIETGTPL